MLEEQQTCFSREIRESLDKHTKAIERLITQQGRLENELKSISHYQHTVLSDLHTTFPAWEGVPNGHAGESKDGDDAERRGTERREKEVTAQRRTIFPHTAETFEALNGGVASSSAQSVSCRSMRRQAARAEPQAEPPDMQLRATQACERLKEELEEEMRHRSWCGQIWRCPSRTRAWCKKRSTYDCRQAVKDATKSTTFDLAFGFLILCNAALIGAEVDYQATHEGRVSSVMTAFQQFFGVIFLLELMLRVHAEGRRFLRGPGWKWNVFDLVLVSTFVADFASAFLFELDPEVSSSFAGRLLRAARFCRILRTLRLVRATSYAHEFRKMAYALQHSAHTLFWALLLLFVVVYCFATTFTQATTDFFTLHKIHGSNATAVCKHDGTVEDAFSALREVCELEFYWGTLPKAIYFLYAALSGGVNWAYIVNSLGHVDWTFKALFILYISVSFFGVLNVVTSVFVECAMASTQHFMDIQITESMNIKKMHVNHLSEVFKDVDVDGSGQLTEYEMEELLKNKHLAAYLESIDIRQDDAWLLFHLLDGDGSGQISIIEFCDGCLRLKGTAKSFDIHRLVWENKRMMKRLQQHTDTVDTRMLAMITMLNAFFSSQGLCRAHRSEEKPSPAVPAEAGPEFPEDDLQLPQSPDEVENNFHKHWGDNARSEIQRILGEVAADGLRPTPSEPSEQPHPSMWAAPTVRVNERTEDEIFGI